MDPDIDLLLVPDVNLDGIVDDITTDQEVDSFLQAASLHHIGVYADWNLEQTMDIKDWAIRLRDEAMFKYAADEYAKHESTLRQLDVQIQASRKGSDQQTLLLKTKDNLEEIMKDMMLPPTSPNVERSELPTRLQRVEDIINDISIYKRRIQDKTDVLHLEFVHHNNSGFKSIWEYYTHFKDKIPKMKRKTLLYYSMLYFFRRSITYNNAVANCADLLVAYECDVPGIECGNIVYSQQNKYHKGGNFIGRMIMLMSLNKMPVIQEELDTGSDNDTEEHEQEKQVEAINEARQVAAEKPRTPTKPSRRIVPTLLPAIRTRPLPEIPLAATPPVSPQKELDTSSKAWALFKKKYDSDNVLGDDSVINWNTLTLKEVFKFASGNDYLSNLALGKDANDRRVPIIDTEGISWKNAQRYFDASQFRRLDKNYEFRQNGETKISHEPYSKVLSGSSRKESLSYIEQNSILPYEGWDTPRDGDTSPQFQEMFHILSLKFGLIHPPPKYQTDRNKNQCRDYQALLTLTTQKYIVYNSSSDCFWGSAVRPDGRPGYNYLGQMLMLVRYLARKKTSEPEVVTRTVRVAAPEGIHTVVKVENMSTIEAAIIANQDKGYKKIAILDFASQYTPGVYHVVYCHY